MSEEQAVLNERLSAAHEQKADHEEELCDSKEENLKNQRLDTTPKIVLVSGNVHIPPPSPGPGLNQETPRIKEEPTEPSIKKEEEQLPVAPSPVHHSAALRQKYGSILFSAPAESARINFHSSDHPRPERTHTASRFSNPDEGRKRKRKFDPKELKVLVDGVNAHYHELKKQNGTINRRNAIWQEITNRVNAVGHKNRAPCEIKRRWQDVRRRTKEKVIINNSSESGGGPSDPVPLDTIEEQVFLTFCEDDVNGIPEIDNFISDQDLCENSPYSSTMAPASSSHPPPAASSPSPSWQETLNTDSRPGAFGDLDNALLTEMKSQNNTIQDSLDVLTGDIRSMSRVMRVLRGDTRSISKHTLELVSAVTGLTAAVKELTRAVSERRPPQMERENGESAVHQKPLHTLTQGKQS